MVALTQVVLGACPTCEFPVKPGYPLTYCAKCGKDLPAALVTAAPVAPPAPTRVTVVDFDMPFGSMIAFTLKWLFASIPAMLIVAVGVGVASVVMSACVAGLMSTGR